MFKKINYKKLLTRTNLIIAIFGILPLAGYLVGISFYQGRLSAYGVNSDAFPLPLQDIYVEAFWAVSLWMLVLMKAITSGFQMAFTLQGLAKLAGVVFFVTLILYVFIKYKLHIKSFLRKNLQPLKKFFDYLDIEKNAFTKAAGVTGGLAYLAITALWIVLVLLLCWVGLPVAAYHKGHGSETIKINAYLEKGCFVKAGERWSNCKKLVSSDGKQIYEGILVAHTNGYVAFFNKAGSFVFRFPDNGMIVNELRD